MGRYFWVAVVPTKVLLLQIALLLPRYSRFNKNIVYNEPVSHSKSVLKSISRLVRWFQRLFFMFIILILFIPGYLNY